MSKHVTSKSALLLSLLLAVGSAGLVEANETTSPAPAPAETGLVDQPQEHAASTPEVAEEAPVAESADSIETLADGELPETTTAVEGTEATTRQVEPEAVVAPVEGQTVDVRILSTTDLHTNLVNYDYYQDKPAQNVGLAKTAVLIDEAKAENSNVILVDNGDTIQGTPLGTYKSIVDPVEGDETHPMYTALKALGFDAGTLGNHEFNYGLDYLDKVVKTAGLPLVNANVLDAKTGQPLYQTYELITKTFTDTTGAPVSLKIGITGITPPQILNWDKAHLEGKVVVRDAVEALTELVPHIRQAGADVVIVLSHSGIGDDQYDKGEENVGYQIAGIPGVDAVVTGHSHAEFPAGGKGFYSRYAGVDDVNGLINGTPVTMAGKYGDHLGVIDLNLTYVDGKWATNSAKGAIRKIDTKSEVANETVVNLAKEAHEGTVAYVRQQVGTTTAPITSYFALVKDDPSIQIVNNAQIWYAKQELVGTPEADLPILSAAAPFKAGGRNFSDVTNYTDIPAGAIAIKNVADLYLYDNVTAILKLTGADIKEWLEMSAGQFNQIDPSKSEPQSLVNPEYRTYNFDVIDGLTYLYDVTQPAKYDRSGKLLNEGASRVRDLRYNGQPIDEAQEFIVVTNNYRASGSFPGVVNATVNKLLNLENRQVIINYILSEKTINPSADNNWGFTDSIKGLDVRFLSADSAKALAEGLEDISYLNPAANHENFGEFRLVYVEPKQDEVKDENKGYQGQATDTQADSGKQPAGQGLSLQERKDLQDTIRQTLVANKPAATASAGLATTKTSASQASLPATGGTSGAFLSLIGANLLALAGFLGKKAKKD